MQILRAGTIVHARRHRWRVVDTRAYDGCQLVTLSGIGAANAGLETLLLVPFDSVEPVRSSQELRFVRCARWRRACRELLSRSFSEDSLCAAGRARIDLLPHQLEPAIAVIRGHGCRLLLADAVGLGKTIQAGVTIAELRARGAADRVLILTPAGLREQWAEELSQRFDIHADIVDFRSVARRVSALPYGVNPWTTWPIAIASIDYAKRAEVLPAVVSCSWDVVVVDEAHGLANDSDRHEAVAALAARAAYVILLTATPHNGDARAFRSLCGIGAHHDRLLVFRRSRDVMTSGTSRHVHRLLLRPSTDERRMHALLADFSRAVRAERGDANRDVWLALAVLHKRAYSSARALRHTVARRLAAMDLDHDGAQQLALPLDPHGETDAGDEAPGWQPAISLRDPTLERRLLTSLAAAAEAAAARETKLSALRRLLKRITEPVIVFTEYRDTLATVADVARTIGRPVAILHGGLSRLERSAALQAFAAGGRAILLATDAAGEGLNLHRGCRTVINLELPWNPMRLEQRIGRVDRIGQDRTVHAFHLIAAGTGEHRLLADLRAKITRAQTDIGAPNPLGDAWGREQADVDHRAARLVVGDVEGLLPETIVAQPGSWTGIEPLASYQADAVAEARRLDAERVLARGIGVSTPVQPRDEGPLAAIVRNTTTRTRLGARVLMIWEVALEDGTGRCVQSRAIATTVSLARLPRARSDGWTDSVVGLITADALAQIEAVAAPWHNSAIAVVRSFVAARLRREHSFAAAVGPAVFQPGLFDRRVHHAQAAARAARQQMADASARRMAILEHRAELSVLPPALRLVLVP
jgi:superfamily II DNA or RNA helicase